MGARILYSGALPIVLAVDDARHVDAFRSSSGVVSSDGRELFARFREGAAMDVGVLDENCQMARESALVGNYERASVFYQSAIAQISRHINKITLDDPRRCQWSQVSRLIYLRFCC